MIENVDNQIELPKGWIDAQIKDLRIGTGSICDGDWILSADLKTGKEVRLIQLADIGEGRFLNKSKKFISKERSDKLGCTLLVDGDILVSRMAGPIARSCILPKLEYDCITAVDVTILRLDPNFLDKQYVSWLFNSRLVQNAVEKLSSGTTRKRISRKNLETIPILLPPLSEQKRISDKIDELFSFLDAGIASLRKIQTQLKRYRQVVLKYAFEGKLTEEWRKALKLYIEPAQILLRNLAERPKTSLMFGESLQNLPVEWMWVKLGDVADLTSGKAFQADEYSEKGISLLQIANVSFGKIIWENKVYLPEDYCEKYPNLVLKNEDVILALNRPILEGMLKVGQLHDKDVPAILYQRVGRFDFYYPFLKLFLYNYFQSPQFVDCLKRSLQGVDQPFVNKPRLLEIPVPIAPLKEQKLILEQIQYYLSLCEKVGQIAEQSLRQGISLRQSILKSAFEGKLVPQNPKDEPAEILLERIKSECIGNKKYKIDNRLELSNYVK